MAQQILKVMTELSAELPISISLSIGGIPSSKQISALKKNPRIIIATPGRLNDHLVTNKLLLQNMEFVVIDEADRMLDMGFAPQLKNIQNTLRGKRQTLMFSASFNPVVESIAQLFLSDKALMIRSALAEAPVASLKQRVLFISAAQKNDRLLDELNATKGGVIVFCGNQANCERMGQYLKEYGYKTDLIHGGLSQGHRNRVVRHFREGLIRVLVATDLLARGIDVPHVDHVFNFDLPFQTEDFLHRIGRTARAGRRGDALTFVTANDSKMYHKIKPYLDGATEIKLDPNFTFSERSSYSNQENRYKKLDNKKPLDGSRKATGKPAGKSISRFDKPKKAAEAADKKPRNDKYKELAAKSSGLGKPSVWKKNNLPPFILKFS
jgi:superfamily II DNA/RNA helicase